MRTTYFTLGAAALLAVVAACGGGGGGGSSSTPVTPAASPSGQPFVNQNVVNFSGPKSRVTVSINIPRHATTSQAERTALRTKLRSIYGYVAKDKNLRSMGNTSPTASIRTAGVRQNAYAAKLQQSTGRAAEYVSGATQYMEYVLTSGNTVLVDETTNCPYGSSTCTGTFDAPIGSGYTITLYLYDYCTFLLSAGSSGPVTIVEGQDNPVTVTLNGVVAYLQMNTTASYPLFAFSGSTQNFTVGVTPLDWDENPIGNPGVLMDGTFHQITSIALTPTANASPPGISPLTTTPIAVPSDLSLLPGATVAYAWDGTGTEYLSTGNVSWSAVPQTSSSALIPTPAYYNGPYVTNNGYLSIGVSPQQLTWSNAGGYAPPSGPLFTLQSVGPSDTSTYASLEFPAPVPLPTNGATPPPPTQYTLGLNENVPYTGTITFADVNCLNNGVIDAVPTPIAVYSPPATVSFGLLATSPASCSMTASDGVTTAYLTINVDQSTLTIQRKARAGK